MSLHSHDTCSFGHPELVETDEGALRVICNHYGLATIGCNVVYLADDHDIHTIVRCSDCASVANDGTFQKLPNLEVVFHLEHTVMKLVFRWVRWQPWSQTGLTLSLSDSASVPQDTCTCSNPSDVLKGAPLESLPTSNVGPGLRTSRKAVVRDYSLY